MKFLDEAFFKKPLPYILQSLLASITMFFILTFLDIISHTAIIASLGATAFIVFTLPHKLSSRLRSVVGGYVVSIIVGCGCSILSRKFFLLNPSLKIHYVIFGALSVGISLFLMAITDTEHPPAAGMALGLVINTWDYNTLLFIVGAVVVMYSVKRILRPLMVDLI